MRGDEKEAISGMDQIGDMIKPELVSQIATMASNLLEKGMNPKEAFGISDAKIETTYTEAYRLFNAGKFDEAGNLFRMLMILEPTEPKHPLALASCMHMLKEFENAIKVYMLAGMLDPENPTPHFHASDCYIQMRDPASAMLLLEMAIQRAGNKPEYQIMKERALFTVEGLKKEIAISSNP